MDARGEASARWLFLAANFQERELYEVRCQSCNIAQPQTRVDARLLATANFREFYKGEVRGEGVISRPALRFSIHLGGRAPVWIGPIFRYPPRDGTRRGSVLTS